MAYHKGDLSTARSAFLVAAGYGGADKQGTNEMLLAWLQNNGATSKSLNSAWFEFLVAQGFATGAFNDRKSAYFKSLGLDTIAGAALSDMEREFWAGSYGPP